MLQIVPWDDATESPKKKNSSRDKFSKRYSIYLWPFLKLKKNMDVYKKSNKIAHLMTSFNVINIANILIRKE